jgi:hypothetical protein
MITSYKQGKIGRELTKIGLIKRDKRMGGKTIKVWKGIQ